MPPLGSRFVATSGNAIALSTTAEAIRIEPSYKNIKSKLTILRVESLYEMSFLRLFASWEVFIEDSVLHMLCGFRSGLYAPRFQAAVARYATLEDARRALYGAQDYLLWYDPARIQTRCATYLLGSPQEAVAASNSARLGWFASIRHRIAHDSEDARAKFDTASMNLAGHRFPRSRPGKLLRSRDAAAGTTFLESIGTELSNLAIQIAP